MMIDTPPPIVKPDEHEHERGKAFTKKNEGLRLNMYLCPAGYLTIGYGHNLEAKPISNRSAEMIFEDDYADAKREAADVVNRHGGEWDDIDPVRQEALIDMSFQMGRGRLLGFKNMLAAIARRDWKTAKRECLDSKYARLDSPARARRVARMLLKGEYP